MGDWEIADDAPQRHYRTVQLQSVDGARGDSDLTANGVIVDPGGPGGRVDFPLWLPLLER